MGRECRDARQQIASGRADRPRQRIRASVEGWHHDRSVAQSRSHLDCAPVASARPTESGAGGRCDRTIQSAMPESPLRAFVAVGSVRDRDRMGGCPLGSPRRSRSSGWSLPSGGYRRRAAASAPDRGRRHRVVRVRRRRADRRARLEARRDDRRPRGHRLRVRRRRGLRELLPAELATARAANQGCAREPRVLHRHGSRRDRPVPVTEAGVVQLPARQLARDRSELELRARSAAGRAAPEWRWLRAEPRTHANRCTLAYWHHPRFSSGEHGSDVAYAAFWDLLRARRRGPGWPSTKSTSASRR